MRKAFLILLAGLATSLFLFPFFPAMGSAINTKMVLAVLGAGAFAMDKSSKRDASVASDILILILLSALISVWALFVVTRFNTDDYSYAKYVVSFAVWMSAAYFVIWFIRQVHGKISVDLICDYVIGVCVFQCILAYLMSLFPPLKSFIDAILGDSVGAMGIIEGRLYGLGAALDPAGLRFSAALVLNVFMMTRTDFGETPWKGALFIIAFVVIAVLGNMIARTTTVGLIISILYLVLFLLFNRNDSGNRSFLHVSVPLILFFVLISIWLYNVSPAFRDNMRFGFEGFFSLVEKGRWEVRSNEVLKKMIVWPETLTTWVIGDGYFNSPLDTPDRFGQTYTGYYMKTDIGYLRFIFYFGTIGMLGMVAFFFAITYICAKSNKDIKWLFITLLLINLVGWLKVSSDIIMVFAPFLVFSMTKEERFPG